MPLKPLDQEQQSKMSIPSPQNVLIGQKLSDFFLEKHEYPSESENYSELPVRVWVIYSTSDEALEICVGPDGRTIHIQFGRPVEVDMEEFGRTILIPQFQDANLRKKEVLDASIAKFEEGEMLTLSLSGGSKLTFACHGDDELRPSFDQSKVS